MIVRESLNLPADFRPMAADSSRVRRLAGLLRLGNNGVEIGSGAKTVNAREVDVHLCLSY
jgi:hypothetical protein